MVGLHFPWGNELNNFKMKFKFICQQGNVSDKPKCKKKQTVLPSPYSGIVSSLKPDLVFVHGSVDDPMPHPGDLFRAALFGGFQRTSRGRTGRLSTRERTPGIPGIAVWRTRVVRRGEGRRVPQ